MSSSNGGKPGRVRVGRRAASARSASPGWSWSSSQRSLVASSGSKNAIGSATWIVTGTPSSPAAAHSGSSRGSSTATSRPSGSRARRPERFQTLRPRAPAATPSRSRAASVSPNAGSSGPARRSRGRRTPRRGPAAAACQRSISRAQPLAPAAVEVDDRLDAGLVQRRRQLAGGPRRPVAAERACRGGCGRRWPGTAAAATWLRGDAQPLTRPEVRERSSVVASRLAHPFRPLSAMPRTKTAGRATNSMIIGARLTSAPAIISGHLPTNWPWKNASPTVVVYWSSWRR